MVKTSSHNSHRHSQTLYELNVTQKIRAPKIDASFHQLHSYLTSSKMSVATQSSYEFIVPAATPVGQRITDVEIIKKGDMLIEKSFPMDGQEHYRAYRIIEKTSKKLVIEKKFYDTERGWAFDEIIQLHVVPSPWAEKSVASTSLIAENKSKRMMFLMYMTAEQSKAFITQ